MGPAESRAVASWSIIQWDLLPNYDVLRKYHADNAFDVSGLVETLRKLNDEIRDPHYEVGISFFLCKDLRTQIEDIWRMEIEPYLREFFFDQQETASKFSWDQIGETILR